MASALISTPVLPANPADARQLRRMKALIAAMRPKFETIRMVTIGTIPVESHTVNDLYGDYCELAALVSRHPAFTE